MMYTHTNRSSSFRQQAGSTGRGSVATGFANLWVVEFGKMLDDTLKSADVQAAFGNLQKTADAKSDVGGRLIFDLQRYTFEDFGAHISLKISPPPFMKW